MLTPWPGEGKYLASSSEGVDVGEISDGFRARGATMAVAFDEVEVLSVELSVELLGAAAAAAAKVSAL